MAQKRHKNRKQRKGGNGGGKRNLDHVSRRFTPCRLNKKGNVGTLSLFCAQR